MNKLVIIAGLLVATSSLAADPPAPAPAPAAPAAPDPAELKAKRDALAPYAKNGTCEGTLFVGGEKPMAFKVKTKPIMGGAWLSTTKEWSKPTARSQQGFIGWDANAKVYKHAEVSSEGNLSVCTAPSIEGDTVVWACEGTGPDGKPSSRRMTETRKGNETHTVGERLMPDGTYAKMVESTCKR